MIDGVLGGFDFGIFWGRKILASIFWVAWFKKRFFRTFKTYVSIFRVLSFNAFWKFFMARKFGMGFVGVLMEALGIFLGFDFVPHSIIPVTWDPEYPPPPRRRDSTVYHCISLYIENDKSLWTDDRWTKINTWLEFKCSKKYGRFSTKSSLFHI